MSWNMTKFKLFCCRTSPVAADVREHVGVGNHGRDEVAIAVGKSASTVTATGRSCWQSTAITLAGPIDSLFDNQWLVCGHAPSQFAGRVIGKCGCDPDEQCPGDESQFADNARGQSRVRLWVQHGLENDVTGERRHKVFRLGDWKGVAVRTVGVQEVGESSSGCDTGDRNESYESQRKSVRQEERGDLQGVWNTGLRYVERLGGCYSAVGELVEHVTRSSFIGVEKRRVDQRFHLISYAFVALTLQLEVWFHESRLMGN